MILRVESVRMYHTILVATDGNPSSESAAHHALGLAHKGGKESTTHGLSIVDTRLRANLNRSEKGSVGNESSAAEEQAWYAVNMISSLGERPGQHIETAVDEGTPHVKILEYAEKHDCDLIVMGSRGRSSIGRVFVGGVTEKVVRLSHLPVLIVPPLEINSDVNPDYNRILHPTDGSEGSAVALEHAIDVAKSYQAELQIVSVVNSQALNSEFAYDVDETLSQLESQAEEHISEAVSVATSQGVEAIGKVKVGIPFSKILNHSRRNDIDLIVMGTQGRTGLDRLLVGSVTERIIRRTRVPVLTVKPQV